MHASITDLKHTQKEATIPQTSISITAMTGEQMTDFTQLGADGRGLDRKPMNFMAQDAFLHMTKSPFFIKPRERVRGWETKAALKIMCFDHIGSSIPDKVPANTIQPLWVRMNVPMKTEPGTYKGTLTIKAKEAEPVAVPVEAEVIEWRVPDPHEFVNDMGLEHDAYAVAIHHLLPKDSPVKLNGRDWMGPKKAKVPLWSDEHFRLLENSFKQLARVGNDLLHVPILHRTEYGNYDDSMIKWIRKKDGTLAFDFSLLDRFLDTAIKHMGKPRVVCFVVMHCMLSSAPPSVTVYDEAKDEYEALGVGWKEDAFKRLPMWKKFGSALIQHMKERGLERSVYWGHAGDHESDPGLMGLFWEVFPGHYWCASGHTYHGGAGGGGHSRNVVRYFADIYGAATPIESKMGWKGSFIGAVPSVETSGFGGRKGAKAVRQIRDETYLYVHCPRDEFWGIGLPIRWRGIISIAQHRGYSGMGHLGFDSYNFNWMKGFVGKDWGFPGRPHHMLAWPGPDGAEPSARYEAFIEGIQEAEARVFMEQAVDRGLLPPETVAKVKTVLNGYLEDYCLWPQLRADTVYDYIHEWKDDSLNLFSTAAEVAKSVGIDIDQVTLKTKVAALGETHRTVLLRNWTGRPRTWEARADREWLKLKETKGELLGFKNLGYYLDGNKLKPGTTIQGQVLVKDTATGREQSLTVIAEVIDPIELRFDHANFNMRCGKTETRKLRLVSHAVSSMDWKLSARQPWLKIEPSSGTIPAGKDMFITFTASPPDKTAVTHDNGLVLSGAQGIVNTPIESKTFVIPLLREKEGRKMPFGKIIKIEDMGENFKFFGTCLKGTKIETGMVKEIGKAHTKAFTNPTVGVHFNAKQFVLVIGNERFSRGMWVYPHHESVYKLEGSRIRAFSAYVGVTNDARQRMIRNHHRRVNFEIWVDGKIVTQSGLMKTNDSARYLTVENLKGAKEIKLITRLDSNKDDNTFLATWADCNFYAEPDERKIFKKDEKDKK
jgi:hypothetical protein